MAELSTLARPYAKAAFEHARQGGALQAWSQQLAVAATIVADETVARLLSDPALTAERQAQVMIGLCGDELGNDTQNFLSVLAENRRLALLPQVSALFDQLKAAEEKSVDVSVISAFELAEGTEQKLAEVLKIKLERDVRVDTVVDKDLIGGVLIRAGDLVIDGSVRGRLNKLAEAMNS